MKTVPRDREVLLAVMVDGGVEYSNLMHFYKSDVAHHYDGWKNIDEQYDYEHQFTHWQESPRRLRALKSPPKGDSA